MIALDMVPEWPEEIEGMPLKVDFVSLLAQAQKKVATGAVDQYMGFIGGLAEIWPEMTDIPDTDQIGTDYAEFLGLGAKMVRPQKERDERRDERMKQQQQQQVSEMASQGAQTVKTLSETPMGEGTALDEVAAQGAI